MQFQIFNISLQVHFMGVQTRNGGPENEMQIREYRDSAWSAIMM